MKRGSAH
ncbi:methyl-accepting chemotaxis protein III, partial [Yersinia pestis PY-98]